MVLARFESSLRSHSTDEDFNGRDWLARQLDAADSGYLKKGNIFVAIADFKRAQALLAAQWQANWAHEDSNLGPHPYQGCALAV
jgi:hypothetical protein